VLPDRSSDMTVGEGRGLRAAAEYWPVQAFIAAAGDASAAVSDMPIANSNRDVLISRRQEGCRKRLASVHVSLRCDGMVKSGVGDPRRLWQNRQGGTKYPC
jgi:hypothetical protein